MLFFIIRRVLGTLLIVFILTSATFFLVRGLPGDPFASDKAMPDHIKSQLQENYGLNKHKFFQYTDYWKRVFQGDLGPSYSLQNYSVSEIIKTSFPISLMLGVSAFIFGVGLGIPIGFVSALNKHHWIDHISMFIAVIGICVPAFVLGPLFQVFLAKNVSWMSVAGWSSPSDWILPTITLGLGLAAYVSRLTRSSVIEVLAQDYIRTAKAKGASTMSVLFKHALRPSLRPTITYLGPAFASIITGSFVIESIFQVPGMGQHFVNSVTSQDYMLLQGLVMFYGIIIAGSNLISDLLIILMNPQLRKGLL